MLPYLYLPFHTILHRMRVNEHVFLYLFAPIYYLNRKQKSFITYFFLRDIKDKRGITRTMVAGLISACCTALGISKPFTRTDPAVL